MLIVFFKLVNLLFMLQWVLLTSIIVMSIKLVPVISTDQVIRHQQGNHTSQYPQHKQVDGGRYPTLITCEGQSANITCLPGTRINLIRANFGRFSISICNEQGNAGMQVDCMSAISFRVLSDLCENKHECHVEASTSKFGDACPGSTKYLEVHYQCISEHKRSRHRSKSGHSTPPVTSPPAPTSSTTTTSAPPFSEINEFEAPSRGNQNAIDIDLSSSKESSLYNEPNYPFVSEEPSLFQPSFSSTPSSLSPSNWPEYPAHDISVQSSSSLPFLPSPLQPSSKSNSSSSPSYSHSPNGSALCPPMNSRDLFWNWTQPGVVVRQNCLILACNFVLLVIAQYAMCKHIAPSLVHKEVKHQDRIKQIRLWARGSLALLFLLGITLSFGIIYMIFPSLITAYLFTGFNVFQGVFIFVFSCLINDKVRREYTRAASRCSWLSWLCCQLCSTFDGEKVSSNPLDRGTFFHPAHQNSSSSPTTHHSSSLIQVTSMTSSTTTAKPSSSGSSAGGGGSSGGGQGIPLSSCSHRDTSFYPESEEPMIGSGSSQLLSGRKIMTTTEDGTTRIYDHSTDADLDCEMETRALMEGLSHSDATSGPMRPIIMRGDVGLTRIPGEHLYECIPEDSAYHSNNLFHSSGLTTSSNQFQQGSNYLHHNHTYHQQQPLASSNHLHHQQYHQTLHHPHLHPQYSSEYQQLHQLINKQHAHSTDEMRRSSNIRDNIKYNDMIVSNTLDRRSTLQRGNPSNQKGSSDELLPAIIRDNTRSPYGVTSLAPNSHQTPKELVASPLSASSSASSASSASTSSNLPTTRLNIPVSPQRTLNSHEKSQSINRKPKTVFAKLKGNQIVSTTGTANGDSC